VGFGARGFIIGIMEVGSSGFGGFAFGGIHATRRMIRGAYFGVCFGFFWRMGDYLRRGENGGTHWEKVKDSLTGRDFPGGGD